MVVNNSKISNNLYFLIMKFINQIFNTVTYSDFISELRKESNYLDQEVEKIMMSIPDYYVHKDYQNVLNFHRTQIDRLVSLKNDFMFWMIFNFFQSLFLSIFVILMSIFVLLNYLDHKSIFTYFFVFITWCILPMVIIYKTNSDTNEYFIKQI